MHYDREHRRTKHTKNRIIVMFDFMDCALNRSLKKVVFLHGFLFGCIVPGELGGWTATICFFFHFNPCLIDRCNKCHNDLIFNITEKSFYIAFLFSSRVKHPLFKWGIKKRSKRHRYTHETVIYCLSSLVLVSFIKEFNQRFLK